MAQGGGKYLIDFGQNMCGRMRLRIASRRSTVICRFGELLHPANELYTDNLRAAQATDMYTASGAEEDIFEPLFTMHGFRYAEISGLEQELTTEDVRAMVLRTDFDQVGDVQLEHPLVSQLIQNIRWTWHGNTVEIPTDCPQRDERLGWTGDIAAFVPSAYLDDSVFA